MKKAIISIISILAFLYLIGEQEEITIGIVVLKFLSLGWLWLVAKANNYFMKENKYEIFNNIITKLLYGNSNYVFIYIRKRGRK